PEAQPKCVHAPGRGRERVALSNPPILAGSNVRSCNHPRQQPRLPEKTPMPARDRKRSLTAFLVALAVLLATPLAVVAADAFTDVPDTNVFHSDIAWLAEAGVTKGCNPPDNTEFCPGDNVTREQMAAFMRRLAENKVVDAATAETADHASTADSATIADSATTADNASNADTVGDVAPTDLVPGGVLPPGSTVRGALNVGG